jgi:anti-sigma factor RsiW
MRYLLGNLSEAEQSAFEKDYLADDQVFAELQLVETELIDLYVREELTTADSASFEQHYLNSPERRQRVEFARALQRTTNSVSASSAVKAMAAPQASSESWLRKLLTRLSNK